MCQASCTDMHMKVPPNHQLLSWRKCKKKKKKEEEAYGGGGPDLNVDLHEDDGPDPSSSWIHTCWSGSRRGDRRRSLSTERKLGRLVHGKPSSPPCTDASWGSIPWWSSPRWW